MRRAFAAAVLAAFALPGAAAAGKGGNITLRPPNTGEFPVLHVTAVTSKPVKRAPTLKEDGHRIPGLAKQNVGETDRAIAIAIDRSNSMQGHHALRDAVAAAKLFVHTKGRGDQVAIFTFATGARQLTKFSTDPDPAIRALNRLRVEGQEGTALYAGIVTAADALARSEPQSRILIVITDGYSYSDRASLTDAVAAANDVDVTIYPIGVVGRQFTPGPLRRLAVATGGAYQDGTSGASLSQLSRNIVGRLSRTWEFTYETLRGAPGRHLTLSAGLPSVGTVEKTFLIPLDAGRPPTPAGASHFFFHSPGGNTVAVILFALIVYLAGMLLLGARNARRIRSRIEAHVPVRVQEEQPEKPLRERFSMLNGVLDATDRVFGKTRLWRGLVGALERADSSLRPATFFYIMVGSGLVVALILAVLGSPAVVIVLGFLLATLIPVFVLRHKASRRQQAFDEQLADLLMTMGGSLRAGHTFRQAMQTIVDEGDEPASTEFKRVLVEVGIGRPVDLALHDMAARMGSKNFDYVISVVSVQREVGGNLATLLDMVSDTVRKRQQFARRVRALTATGRTSAYVVSAMPFFIACLFLLTNRSYIEPLFTTSTGHILIIVALVSIAIGGLVMKRIVSFRLD